MRRAIAVPLAVLCFLTAAPALPARADAENAVATATAKVRGAIPAPVEPEEGKPGLGFEWAGDFVAAGELGGHLKISVDVGTFRDQPVWIVSEVFEEDWAGSTGRTETSLYLSRDLALIRGEQERVSGDDRVHLVFKRDGDGFVVERTITRAEKVDESVRRIAAPEGATYGRGALLLFLRTAPASPATYALPIVPLEAAMPAVDEHEVAPETSPALLEVVGPAKYGSKPEVKDSWLVRWKHGRRAQEIHLSPKDRTLLGVEFQMPPGLRFVPKGKGGTKVVYEDDKPATSWRGAFLKFGHGYHMAVAKWIVDAIHWETMYEHDVKTGTWKGGDLAEFKKAWVDEFLARSKHRKRAEADGLLRMTLATAEESTEADGTVKLATHPEFGGNVYRFRKVGDHWFLITIDQ